VVAAFTRLILARVQPRPYTPGQIP
jgi:hypothetical protein